MKKNLLSMFAVAAGLLMATSCSTKQEEEVTTGGEAVVTFTAQLPSGLGSRAPQKTTEDGGTTTTAKFGDGTKATHLQYAVYKVTTENNTTTWEEISALEGETTLTNLTATVSLQLVTGNTYAVAFWADAPTKEGQKKIYTFYKKDCKITADYNVPDGTGTQVPRHASNDETLDAFYAVETFKVEGSSQKTIKLTRPFAQLNIGTADLDAYKKANNETEVKHAGIKINVPNTLNLKDGSVKGEDKLTFTLANLPTEDFPVSGYKYLAMNYVLMPADKKADNTVTIFYDDESGAQERTFTNVPLQRNYRTNIYGNLLTSTTQFNVEIKSVFDERANDMEIWDGKTTKEPEANADGVLEIYYPSEWAYLCEKTTTIPAGAHIVSKSIKLMADLDFDGHDLKSFLLDANVTVDGNGHKIKNARLVGDKCNTTNQGTFHASLFCAPGMASIYTNVTVQNLTVEGGSVYCPHEDYGYKKDGVTPDYKGHAAVIFASIDNSPVVTLKNVHVKGVNIYGIQPVAGLVGRTGSSTLTIDGCSVENCHLHNKSLAGESGYVATLVGRTDDATKVTITNTESLNNKIEAYYSTSRGLNTINLVAAEKINIDNVKHSGNTATITCVETGKSAESLSD